MIIRQKAREWKYFWARWTWDSLSLKWKLHAAISYYTNFSPRAAVSKDYPCQFLVLHSRHTQHATVVTSISCQQWRNYCNIDVTLDCGLSSHPRPSCRTRYSKFMLQKMCSVASTCRSRHISPSMSLLRDQLKWYSLSCEQCSITSFVTTVSIHGLEVYLTKFSEY